MREKLRIGILLEDYFIPNWEYQIINRIKNSEFGEIVVVIKNNSIRSSSYGKLSPLTRGILMLIEKTDRLVFKTKVDYRLKQNVAETLKNIPCLEVVPESNAFNTREIEAIREINPDIILKFGRHLPAGEILRIPKYGLWSYSIDSSNDDYSPDTGFMEVVGRVPVTNSTLGIINPDNQGVEAIFDSWESTCAYSININRDSVSWRSALFAPRIMNGIYNYGEDYLTALKYRFASVNHQDRDMLPPLSSSDAIRSLVRYTGAVTRSIIRKLLYTDAFSWKLLYDINNGGESFSSGFGSFKKLSSPRGIFWADPFVIAEDDRYCIFVEEFIYRKNKAHISVLTLDKSGNLTGSGKIIERPYHMSYPFIFKTGGTYFMIPETCRNRTIELYRCIEFPFKWEFERNIMENISAVDTTLFQYNDKWWLFTAIDQTANISGCSAELFLFFTGDVLSGKWESHPLNPIVSDIRTARPAGNIFIQDGKICRPSQNCSGRYGIGFNINHITKLTEDEYEENIISEIKPEWDKKLRGTHTLNFDRDFTVIDAYSFRRRFSI